MKKTQNNFGFTLVELIVVITILAILGTIAFISLQGYSAQARDSKRVSDIQNIKKSLELFSLNTGKYPEPDSYFSIKYGSQDLRYQGTIGEQVSTNLSRNLNEKPTDPLTGSEYTYSRTYVGTEYEVLGLYESDLISVTSPQPSPLGGEGARPELFSQSYSANQVYPKLDGNYNGVYVKAGTMYIPTPSIINGNILGNIDLEVDTTALESQVITGGDNIPLTSTGGLTGMTVEVFSGELDTTKGRDEGGNKALLAQALIDAYSGTTLAIVGVYKEIVETSSEGLVSLVDTFVLNDDNFVNSSSDGLSGWRVLDPNCNIDDIVIGDQVWAGCNSTLGTGFEWGKKDDGTNGTIGSCYNYDGTDNSSDSDCAIGNVNMSSNVSAKNFFDLKQVDGYNDNGDEEFDTIWGKLYTWTSLDTDNDNDIDLDDTNKVCGEGYHVPSDAEWITLEQSLGCDSGELTRTGWGCAGLGWSGHNAKNDTNNLANVLKLPLSGYRYSDGSTFERRGLFVYLWSSTFSDVNSYIRYLRSGYSTVNRNMYIRDYGFSVRCIKD